MDSRALIAILGLVLTALASPAFSATDTLQEAADLLDRKQPAQASEKIAQHLQSHPQDGRAKLLQGIILTELKKPEEAAAIFNALIQRYPAWPEPYNNLAVVYARQGEFERARQLLEAALRTHPSYATAHNNLSTLYAAMASEAYGKALKTEQASRPQPRLAMIEAPYTPAAQNVALAAPPETTAARSPLMTVKTTMPAPPPGPVKVATVDPSPAALPVAKAVLPAPAPPDPAPEKHQKPSPEEDRAAEIETVVQNWASAWSRQDVSDYLGYYAKDFKTPKNQNRREWEQQRRSRIRAPKSIEVRISNLKTEVEGARAKVSFKQHYRADRVAKRTSKTLILQKQGKRWLIAQEIAG